MPTRARPWPIPAIGDGPDAARYDAKRKLAFSSNGGGTLTIIDAGKDTYPVLQNLATQKGARTMTLDEVHGAHLPGYRQIRGAACPHGGQSASAAGDCPGQLHDSGGRAEVSLLPAVPRLSDAMLETSLCLPSGCA